VGRPATASIAAFPDEPKLAPEDRGLLPTGRTTGHAVTAVPFNAFSGKLEIAFGPTPNTDSFDLKASSPWARQWPIWSAELLMQCLENDNHDRLAIKVLQSYVSRYVKKNYVSRYAKKLFCRK
jgi:hypothetical protein